MPRDATLNSPGTPPDKAAHRELSRRLEALEAQLRHGVSDQLINKSVSRQLGGVVSKQLAKLAPQAPTPEAGRPFKDNAFRDVQPDEPVDDELQRARRQAAAYRTEQEASDRKYAEAERMYAENPNGPDPFAVPPEAIEMLAFLKLGRFGPKKV